MYFYKKILLLIFILGFLFTGCYDLTIRTELNSDNTGRREIEIIRSDRNIKPDEPNWQDREGIHIIDYEEIELSDNKYLLRYICEFDSLEAFNDERRIIITEYKGNKIYIKEIFKPDEDAMDEDENEEIEEMLNQFKFIYELTMPHKIIKSNADEIDGNKAIWRYTMYELMTETIIIEVECELPSKKSWWQRMCFFF